MSWPYYFRLAAEQGLAAAQIKMAKIYENGREVKADLSNAAKWYEKAAKQGIMDAQIWMGFAHKTGRAVKQTQGYLLNGFCWPPIRAMLSRNMKQAWPMSQEQGLTRISLKRCSGMRKQLSRII